MSQRWATQEFALDKQSIWQVTFNSQGRICAHHRLLLVARLVVARGQAHTVVQQKLVQFAAVLQARVAHIGKRLACEAEPVLGAYVVCQSFCVLALAGVRVCFGETGVEGVAGVEVAEGVLQGGGPVELAKAALGLAEELPL